MSQIHNCLMKPIHVVSPDLPSLYQHTKILEKEYSHPQRPCSFRSAPRIVTSGKVQHRKSVIHRLPVTLHMLRVKSDKSDWLRVHEFYLHVQKIRLGQRSQVLVLTKRSTASGGWEWKRNSERTFVNKFVLKKNLWVEDSKMEAATQWRTTTKQILLQKIEGPFAALNKLMLH